MLSFCVLPGFFSFEEQCDVVLIMVGRIDLYPLPFKIEVETIFYSSPRKYFL